LACLYLALGLLNFVPREIICYVKHSKKFSSVVGGQLIVVNVPPEKQRGGILLLLIGVRYLSLLNSTNIISFFGDNNKIACTSTLG
jgi:hypothetical protein